MRTTGLLWCRFASIFLPPPVNWQAFRAPFRYRGNLRWRRRSPKKYIFHKVLKRQFRRDTLTCSETVARNKNFKKNDTKKENFANVINIGIMKVFSLTRAYNIVSLSYSSFLNLKLAGISHTMKDILILCLCFLDSE